MQLEEALAELYNEMDFSEFKESEKDYIIKKVGNLLKKVRKQHIF